MTNEFASPSNRQPSVLVIDDDAGTRETFNCALTQMGVTVGTASSGAEGLEIARSRSFDLVVIDLRLPDMLGTDLARALQQNAPRTKFLLVSAYLTTRATVEAVRLGAVDVIEKPIGVDELADRVSAMIGQPPAPAFDDIRTSANGAEGSASALPRRARPRSAAERWALNVMKACESQTDVRTLEDWAACAGLSYSSLCESCRLLRIRPHDARDLARVLRAVMRSARQACPLEVLLDVSDRRTLKSLFGRAGLTYPSENDRVSVDEFLARQRFVPAEHEALTVLKQLLGLRPAAM